jgi:ABC-2 type transport system permease protein
VWFVLFFLGGYLLFASLYAAIGSAVENPQEAQSLSVPLTLVVVVPILFIAYVIESPGSTLSVVLSMIPFFSPILMIARIAASEVPFWQVALSYLLLIGGFIGSIWVSSRIYRIGILMYGKKPSFKDLVRWFRYA